MSPPIHPTYARLLRVLLRRLGEDADALLQSAGIDPAVLAHDARPIDLCTASRLAEASMRITARPWLGLELGASIDFSSHGAVGLAVIASPDLRSAVRTIARYGVTRGSMLRWALREADEGATLVVSDAEPLGPARGFIFDVVFGTLARALCAVAGTTEGSRVALPLPKPPWAARYEAMMEAEVEWNAPALAMHLPEALLRQPGLAADAQACRAASRECEAALAALQPTTLAEGLRRRLKAVDDGRYPTLEELAADEGVSARTVIRRLQSEGTSFQRLLDEARQELALWYLQHTGLTVDELAQRLGYEDPSNFSRTCRRWFGEVPSRLRTPPPNPLA